MWAMVPEICEPAAAVSSLCALVEACYLAGGMWGGRGSRGGGGRGIHSTLLHSGATALPRPQIPSDKVTFDEKPEMKAREICEAGKAALRSGKYKMVRINFANPDMVGHTGDLGAAIKAVQAVDTSLGRLERAVRQRGGVLLVTADHGNCELMRDPETGGPHTAHTLDLVPALLVNAPTDVRAFRDGRLADVAPTLLALLGLPQPAEMTGVSLIGAPALPQAAD